MISDENETAARIAYNACTPYGHGYSPSYRKCWEDLDEEEKQAWRHVVIAVECEIMRTIVR